MRKPSGKCYVTETLTVREVGVLPEACGLAWQPRECRRVARATMDVIQFLRRFAARSHLPALAAFLVIAGVASVPAQQAAQPTWHPIPCSQSRFSMEPMQNCLEGPVIYEGPEQCKVYQYTASAVTSQQEIFAYAKILDLFNTLRCYTYRSPAFDTKLRAGLQKAITVINPNAGNWGEIIHVGKATGLYFDFPERHCFAYFLFGRRWQGGYDGSVQGFVCSAAPDIAPTTAEISQILDSVRVRRN